MNTVLLRNLPLLLPFHNISEAVHLLRESLPEPLRKRVRQNGASYAGRVAEDGVVLGVVSDLDGTLGSEELAPLVVTVLGGSNILLELELCFI